MTGAWALLALCTAAHVAANLALKRGMLDMPPGFDLALVKAAITQPWLWLGGVLAVVVLGSYLLAIRELPASVAYPIASGTGMAGLALAGALLFGETLPLQAILGIGVVLGGVLLIYFA